MCFKRHHRTSSTISARSHHSISSCTEEDEEVCFMWHVEGGFISYMLPHCYFALSLDLVTKHLGAYNVGFNFWVLGWNPLLWPFKLLYWAISLSCCVFWYLYHWWNPVVRASYMHCAFLWCCLLCCTRCFCLLSLRMTSWSVTIQRKALEWFFSVVLFIVPYVYKVGQTLTAMDELLWGVYDSKLSLLLFLVLKIQN